jgi:hypothetical protein
VTAAVLATDPGTAGPHALFLVAALVIIFVVALALATVTR